ncbi:MAG: hypothetical protein ACK54T_01865 [bacterium]
MKTKHASHLNRTARLHGRAVHLLTATAFAAVSLLLLGGCGKGGDPKSAQATGETSPPASEPEQAPSPPAGPTGVPPAGDTQIIEFVKRGLIPFKMDATLSADYPAVIRVTPLPESLHEHIRAVLQREIDRYPPGVLTGPGSHVLDMVMVGDKITINRESVSGAYMAGGLVFISVGAAPKPGHEQDAYIARTLHHELSSAFKESSLFKGSSQRFDEKRFRDALPPGFVYDDEKPGANPTVAMRGVNAVGNIQDVADGFLTQYPKTTLGQDFNSYAEVLLWKPELLLETFAPDSRVGRKARVVRDFYIAIDKRFEDYFAPLGK